MSKEATYAETMALFYKQRGLLQHSRADRVAAVKREIEELEAALELDMAARKADHAACLRARRPDCEGCRKRQHCFKGFTGKRSPRHNDISERLILLATEQADEEYAAEALTQKVNYRRHKDGFCRYWQNLRARRFALNNWRCETPGCEAAAENCHHLHYDTLGYEELDDVGAPCRQCHATLHKVPA